MRTKLAASLSFIALSASMPAYADWNWCAGAKELAMEMDLRGVTTIEVRAVAGDLNIRGVSGPTQLTAKGKACVQNRYRDRIDEIRIIEEHDGNVLRVIAHVPERGNGNSLIGGLDLTLTVPSDMPITVYDSSGDLAMENTGPVTLTDSSGDIDIRQVNGDVTINVDSSGDLDIRGAGIVDIKTDSSGDISVEDALSLRVGRDSSGDIEANNISGDVYVGTDSSGDIDVVNVAGSLTVERDGSGSIDYRRVAGRVDIPKSKRDD